MNLLVATIFLPLVGAALIWTLSELERVMVRRIALLSSLATLVLAALVVLGYPQRDYSVDLAWLSGAATGDDLIDVRLGLGLDGLSLWLFGLSALLTVTAVLVSWEAIEDRTPLFYMLLLLLETGMLGVFAARDIILFYVFFEFTLIPLFFLIGIWGSEERRYAATKFFLFTLAGSVLTFLGLLAVVFWCYQHSDSRQLTFSMGAITAQLAAEPMDATWQLWIFLALFAGFAIKVPLFPLHTWLPLAHVQAPTAGSVLLAGILLKIGSYGFVRFSLPWLPEATALAMPYILWLSVAGILYGALVALAQTDMKRLIAYSSVSHLGFCMLGLFALNPLGLEGGVLQMVNHGLSTGGLFAVVGMLYERYHTREIRHYSGIAKRMPWLAFFMVVFTMSSIGLPGLNGFVGEFLILIGMFQRGFTGAAAGWGTQLQVISVLAVLGVVLGAWYMLWLVQRVFFGPLREPGGHGDHAGDHQAPVRDLSPREILALAPLVVLIVWIGVAPQFLLNSMEPALRPISQAVEAAYHAPRSVPPVESAARRAAAEIRPRVAEVR